MGKVKIIFFDIDGTLIDFSAKNISEKMLETLVLLASGEFNHSESL